MYPFLLSLLCAIFSLQLAVAAPKSAREKELLETRYHYLSERGCAGTPCGWSQQLCCTGGQTCSTNNLGQAICTSNGGNGAQPDFAAAQSEGQWQLYTTTSVRTDLTTVTLTYSSFFGSETSSAPGSSVSGISCDTSMGEKPCGTICCASGQMCAYAGQCAASGDQEDFSSSYLASISSTEGANTATAFIRPTSSITTTTTATGSMTTTVGFQPASAATSGAAAAAGAAAPTSNNGLSGGAIAGIVIGVIAGIIILFLICACLCFGAALDGILAFFGLKSRRRRREETYIEERHSHHASGGGGRTWFGTRPARIDRPKKKKSSGLGGFTGVAAALATLAVVLGLRRRNRRKKESEISDSEYSYSVTYDSASSASSDRRTRDTRRSGRR